MANPYCTRGDLYRYGLPRGSLTVSARLVASVDAAADLLVLDGHGFETDDAIEFRAAEGGLMPSPLVAGTTYYAIRVSDVAFKVAATASGSAINLTSTGDSVLVGSPLPIDDVIEFYSRWVDTFLPHGVPMTTIPVLVKGLVAELSAKKLMQLAGHKADSVDEAEKTAMAQLQRFAAGVPVRDAAATVSSNKAAVSSYVTTAADARGWKSGVLP